MKGNRERRFNQTAETLRTLRELQPRQSLQLYPGARPFFNEFNQLGSQIRLFGQLPRPFLGVQAQGGLIGGEGAPDLGELQRGFGGATRFSRRVVPAFERQAVPDAHEALHRQPPRLM